MESMRAHILGMHRSGERLDNVRSARIDALLDEADLQVAPSPGSVSESAAQRRQRRLEESWPPPSDPNVALVAAVASGDLDAMRSALRDGADPNFRAGGLDEPVLSIAVRRAAATGDHALVGELLGAGANPNHASRQGETSLHVAASVGSPVLVDMLSRAGADPFRRDLAGRTPKELAVVALGRHQVASHAVFGALDRCEARRLGPTAPQRSPITERAFERG